MLEWSGRRELLDSNDEYYEKQHNFKHFLIGIFGMQFRNVSYVVQIAGVLGLLDLLLIDFGCVQLR